MNSNGLGCCLLILIMAFSTSCVKTPKLTLSPVAEKSEFSLLADCYRQRAERCEARNDLYMAREFLKVANQLMPEDRNASGDGKIAALSAKIRTESERLYEIGVAFYAKGKDKRALRAFLEALRINPRHEGALFYTLDKLKRSKPKFYEVTEDIDLPSLAEKVYDDPGKSVFIAYLNDMEKSAVAKKGRILFIPPVSHDWERIVSKSDFDIEKNIEKAREHLETEKYEDAIDLAAEIQEHDPENPLAADIKSEAWLQIARHYEEYKKYNEALDAMIKVDPDYEPAQKYMAHLQKIVKDLADHHYKTGVQYFVDENLEKAIVEWEQALALDPNNQKARQDIENAKKLLEKLGEIK